MTVAIDLLNRDLPKWSQMIVTGKSVTEEQAKDIIFRTDSFLTDPDECAGGNDIMFNDYYQTISGLKELRNNKNIGRIEDIIKTELDYVSTEYVHNEWASCAFIFGAHGWCSPTGEIMFSDNVGKYPSIQEVLNDWASLATAFPYLDLNVTLMCEDGNIPIVNIKVLEGAAILQDPNMSVHNGKFATQNYSDIVDIIVNDCRTELGLPKQWYKDYASMVRNKLIELQLIKGDLENTV